MDEVKTQSQPSQKQSSNTTVKAYAVRNATDTLAPFSITRRKPGPHDVVIDIDYCGICHSDIHQVRDEWRNAIYPMVPGHEIVGTIREVGAAVKNFKKADKVGVGCFVDSCRQCDPCKKGLEQFCEKGMSPTYNGYEQDEKTPTYGGYSKSIVVDENYVLRIPDNLSKEAAAPLLCAGITTYSPLKHWQVKKGDKVAVIGLGGLGHMAIKLATAMGAEVTVFSTSDKKEADAKRLGATRFVNSKKTNALKSFARTFHFMINTASGNINLDDYLNMLKLDGTMVVVGAPEKPFQVNASPLISRRCNLAGSLIGGIAETQAMLDFCGTHNITADIELIPIQQVNEAYERMLKGDVHYRFVIDLSTL